MLFILNDFSNSRVSPQVSSKCINPSKYNISFLSVSMFSCSKETGKREGWFISLGRRRGEHRWHVQAGDKKVSRHVRKVHQESRQSSRRREVFVWRHRSLRDRRIPGGEWCCGWCSTTAPLFTDIRAYSF